MNDRALAVYDGGGFELIQRTAAAMVQSGYFKDARDQAQAIVKVMAGAEIGIPPFAAMTGIHIIQGKPALGANLIATLVKNDPRYDYKIASIDDSECWLQWYEDGKPSGLSSFSIAEAKRAGLTGNANWQKYPSDMLFARALTRGARRYAPGIFGGAPVYTADELGADMDEDGHIIDVTPAPVPYTVIKDGSREPEPVEWDELDARGDNAPQAQAEREEMRPKADDGKVADLRASLTENGPVTWATVASAVMAVSDHYRDAKHVYNALNKDYGWPVEGYEASGGKRVKGESAVKAFDWLLARGAITRLGRG